MYALYLLIAVAAFGLWYGLSILLRRMDKNNDDPKESEDHHGDHEHEHEAH